ncbi:hypothetical protein C5748_27025 [Phyllobacterium phragmitis]|uniref:DNA-binding protein n=1 Tax=Phyllobacterium phragmitis TaxID=2670329 RepID=A0A2S9IIV8_9HYPH|nr:hypothetical protein [Phyllobacterium phragmitis]PRD40432.1 hypothetical protein C5748_27025 [Phyllobacterium phragmitis]
MSNFNREPAHTTSRPRLRRKEVPAYLQDRHGIDIAYATLEKLATIGGGPAMQYAGRIPLYHRDDLDLWAEARLSKPVRSTSERGL